MTDKITTDAEGGVVTIEKAPPRVFVEFTRTLNLGEYNSVRAQVNMEVAIPLEASQDDIETQIKTGFFVVKQAVYNQLGLEATVTPEGFVRETLERAGLSGVEVSPAEVTAAVEQAANTPRPASKTSDKDAAWDDLRQDILANGLDGLKGWWDNRESARGTRKPAFKAKRVNKRIEENVALWTDKAPAEVKQLLDA